LKVYELSRLNKSFSSVKYSRRLNIQGNDYVLKIDGNMNIIIAKSKSFS